MNEGAKKTFLLSDFPVDEDEFGSHRRIADKLAEIVRREPVDDEHVPHSIALLGEWGSGKSSVIRILEKSLAPTTGQSPVAGANVATFVYDAWAHEGDGLRRAFLDTLFRRFSPSWTEEEQGAAKKLIWDRHETTTTTTEPVLRRHGKILALSIVLAGIGLRFFNDYPDSWNAGGEWLWDLFFGIAVNAPLIVLAGLFYVKYLAPMPWGEWLFGVAGLPALEGVKITSIFFQKVEGQTDHKWTTDPADSIQQFRDAFYKIVGSILVRSEKLVVVVDNIDRLQPDEARAFWSTMQAFFDPSTSAASKTANRIWLIVPLSPSAIQRLFGAGVSGAAEGKALVEKTFEIAFIVPPAIQVDSRAYLLKQLKRAFPAHPGPVLENVRNLFDYHRGAGGAGNPGALGDTVQSRKTPREMKLFVNQLVALYRTQSSDVSLEAMAAYLLLKDRIDTDGLGVARDLPPYELSLLPPTPDVEPQFAAVHFGVRLDAAAQVVLSDPILRALTDGDETALEALALQSGFVDVLEKVISSVGNSGVDATLDKASMLDGVEESTHLDLHSIWTTLLRELGRCTSFRITDDAAAEGIGVLARRLYADEKSLLVATILSGLAGGWFSPESIGEGDDAESLVDYEARMAQAEGWIAVVRQVVDLELLSPDAKLAIPKYRGFAVRALGALRRDDAQILKMLSTELDLSSAAVANGIATWPGKADVPPDPIEFCLALKTLSGETANWSALVAVCSKQLSGDAVPVIKSGFAMLLGLARLSPIDKAATEALKVAIEGGQLGVSFKKVGSDVEFAALALVAILATSPENTADVIGSRQRATDGPLADLVANRNVSEDLVAIAAALLVRLADTTVLLGNIGPRSQHYAIGARLFQRLLSVQAPFGENRYWLGRAQPFLIWAESQFPIADFFERLVTTRPAIKEYSRAAITPQIAFVASRIYRTSAGKKSVVLRNRLAKYIDARSSDDWELAIADPKSLLLEIAEDILTYSGRHAVGVQGLDALVSLPVRLGAKLSTPTMKEGYVRLWRVLDDELRPSLPSRMWRQILPAEPDVRRAMVLLGGELLFDLNGTDASSVVDAVIVPFLTAPDETEVRWMLGLVDRNSDAFGAISEDLAEVRARITAAVRPTSSVPNPTKKLLRRLQKLLPKKPKVLGARRKKTRKHEPSSAVA